MVESRNGTLYPHPRRVHSESDAGRVPRVVLLRASLSAMYTARVCVECVNISFA